MFSKLCNFKYHCVSFLACICQVLIVYLQLAYNLCDRESYDCWHHERFSRNKFAFQGKKSLNCIKYRGNIVDCVDTTMFPLQATMFFSNNRAVFNGSVFARVVWSCFPMLDYEERWRASISLTSYQWVLGRGSQGSFVPTSPPAWVSLCRDSIIFYCAVLCFVVHVFSLLSSHVFSSHLMILPCKPVISKMHQKSQQHV